MKEKLLFFATEDWFVRSHFAALVARAVADGYDTIVAARMNVARDALAALGARTIDLPHGRGDLSPLALTRAALETRAVLVRERPALVHAIALKPIVIAALAAPPDAAQVFALTGRGHLATSANPLAALARGAARSVIAARVRGGAYLAVENIDDRLWLEAGRALPDERVAILPGAGVDPDHFAASPEPAGPIRIGIVSRLVRSKGVDVAVEAFKGVRATHSQAELWIAGTPDDANPASVAPAHIAAWSRLPGVRVLGHCDDVAGFWRETHIACLASRGGEGLPRSLIEAAACARPIVTTDVPGCRDFVVDGVTGLLVPPEATAALSAALTRLAANPGLRQHMGAAGRARVLAGYTTGHVADLASALWRRASAGRRAR